MMCPWDVISYENLLCSEPDASPRAFWMNTSGNYIIWQFLRMSTPRIRREMEINHLITMFNHRWIMGRKDNGQPGFS